MSTQAKIEIVNEVQNKLENSSGVYFADYKGLNVEKINEPNRFAKKCPQ